MQRRDGWRWRNVPVPEPHLAGLLLGAALHRRRPWRLSRNRRLARRVGWAATTAGILLVAWAVRAAGDVEVADPAALVRAGPYAFSRNPMYAGWTLLYVGFAFLANALWPLLFLPAVASATHRAVLREERSLERAFGDEYRSYRRDVGRYL